MLRQLTVVSAIITASFILSACGGGSSNNNNNPPPPPPPPPPTNNPPTADAGSDQAAVENTTVQLAGQATDPDGDTVSVEWSQLSGPAVVINSATSLNATVELPAVAIGATASIVLEMTATDARGASASDQLTLTVDSNDYLLFTADRDVLSVIELYKYDARTESVQKLSGTPAPQSTVQGVAISPDGQSVAYLADRDVAGRFHLYVASVDGSSNERVSAPMANADGSVDAFTWSPDGLSIAYVADADVDGITEAYIVGPDGADHRKISEDTLGAHRIYDVRWSPDGRYVVQQLVVTDLLSGFAADIHDTSLGTPNNARVTPAATFDGIIFPVWSADSSRIGYFSLEPPFDSPQLFTSLPDGSGQVHVSNVGPNRGIVIGFAFSPAGDRVAYWSDDTNLGEFDLYTAQADGSDNTKINEPLSANRNITDFSWAPDGSRIAYIADIDVDEVFELYTALPDGRENVKVSGTLGAGRAVDDIGWSPDGSRIAYTADQDTDELFELYVSSADGTVNDKVSGLLPAGFDAQINSFDNELWSPDSTRLVYQSGELYVANAASLVSTQVTLPLPPPQAGGAGGGARWSADGSRISYVRIEVSPPNVLTEELFIVAPDGSGDRSVSGPPLPGGRIADAGIWSP